MKIVKSKISIAIIGFGIASLVGAVSYAALSRPVIRPSKVTHLAKKPDAPQPVAMKRAPHEEELDSYLDKVRSYMQTPPRDGVFGSDRIPTLHGKESANLPAYEAIRNLEGHSYVRSVVLGLEPSEFLKEEKQYRLENGVKPQMTDADKIRLSDVHFVTPDRDDSDAAATRWDSETAALRRFAVDIRKKGLEEDVQQVTINGNSHWIVGKAVHASVKSCYKCHSNVEPGKPIGYVAALIRSDAK